jgi:hypothetical protein
MEMRILVIPNSLMSIFAIFEYIENLSNNKKIIVDLIFVETMRDNLRKPLIEYLKSMPKVDLTVLTPEINHFELTDLQSRRKYRTRFVNENIHKITNSSYDEIILANIFLLGLIRKLRVSRSKIKLVDHGISDVLPPKNRIKMIFIKLYGELEQKIFGYGINPIFYLSKIKIGNTAPKAIRDFWESYTQRSEKDLSKSVDVIFNMPHIFRIHKERYVDLLFFHLKRLRIKNCTIYCKSHPSIDTLDNIFINNAMPKLLGALDTEFNKYIDGDSKEPLERYLNSKVKLLIGEISTSMLLAKYLYPEIQVVMINFNHLFQHSITILKSQESIKDMKLNGLSNNFYEYKNLYKRFGLRESYKYEIAVV